VEYRIKFLRSQLRDFCSLRHCETHRGALTRDTKTVIYYRSLRKRHDFSRCRHVKRADWSFERATCKSDNCEAI